MKVKPILFNTPMVQALLDGEKTMTRRVVKNFNGIHNCIFNDSKIKGICPYGAVGDLLYVRETIRKSINPLTDGWGVYVAGDEEACDAWHWKKKSLPPMHMPRGLSRLTLEITDVKVERLQDISRGDAMAEGRPFPNIAKETDPVGWFKALWQSINGKDSWESNPWVWGIEFKVHKINVDNYIRSLNDVK